MKRSTRSGFFFLPFLLTSLLLSFIGVCHSARHPAPAAAPAIAR